jgi:hypothetical protein
MHFKTWPIICIEHGCNPSIWEAEIKGLQVPSQSVLHSEILFGCPHPKKKKIYIYMYNFQL